MTVGHRKRKRRDIEDDGTKKTYRNDRSFYSGVMLLTASNLIVKVTGLLFKIPMNYIVGDTGMGYFNSAYSIYTFFYMLSTSGLPVALAVMISEYKASGRIAAARTVFRAALWLFALGGGAIFLLMYLASDTLAALIRSELSSASVAVAAPTILFVCVASAVRGYFQGCGNMLPTAVSQLIEALGKTVIGLSAAVYAVRIGKPVETVSAYAVSGLTLGSFAGMLYLCFTKLKRGVSDVAVELPREGSVPPDTVSYRAVLGRFLHISLPITVSASVMSLTNMLDTALIQRVLTENGMPSEEAAALFGNYTSLAVPMFNLPPVLVYPIAYSLVPRVASAVSSGDTERTRLSVETALRAAVAIGMPCALGLTVLAEPILCLFYRADSAHLAAPLLTLLAPSSFFVCILAVTNSILQSCGAERRPVIAMLCGAVVKCVSSVILLGRLGIVGAPLSTFLCYLTVTVINLSFTVGRTGIRPSFFGIFFPPAVSGLLCAVTAVLVNDLLDGVLGRLACPIAILCAAAVYFALMAFGGQLKLRDIIPEKTN